MYLETPIFFLFAYSVQTVHQSRLCLEGGRLRAEAWFTVARPIPSVINAQCRRAAHGPVPVSCGQEGR